MKIPQYNDPENYKIKHDIEVLDNFDDMNTIIRRINFENVDLKTTNIFTVNDSNNLKKKIDNYWYAKFSESFNNLFDKKFLNQKNNLSALYQHNGVYAFGCHQKILHKIPNPILPV